MRTPSICPSTTLTWASRLSPSPPEHTSFSGSGQGLGGDIELTAWSSPQRKSQGQRHGPAPPSQRNWKTVTSRKLHPGMSVTRFGALIHPLPVLLRCKRHVACSAARQQREGSFPAPLYVTAVGFSAGPWVSHLQSGGDICPRQYQNGYSCFLS